MKKKGFLFLILVFVFVLSLFLGRYPKPYFLSIKDILNDPLAIKLVLNLRLPRVFAALILGISLASAGFVMQTAFRNPLADPGILGVSQGAGFGAALSIVVLNYSSIWLQIYSAFFGVFALLIVLIVSKGIHVGNRIISQILAGIAVSAFFSAGIGFLKYIADPLSQLPNLIFWLLGSLSSVRWENLILIIPILIIGNVSIFALRWRINSLSLQKEVAFSLGFQINKEYILLLTLSVLITSCVISIAGIVSWIGLIIPNLARMLVGSDSDNAIPVSMTLGGIFAIICDDFARVLIAGEIPLGILTAFIGALMFFLLVTKRNNKLLK